MKILPVDRQDSGRKGRPERSPAGTRRFVAALLVLGLTVVATLSLAELLFPNGIGNTVRAAAIAAGYGYHGDDTRLRVALARWPGRILQSAVDAPEIPRLVIDIGFKNLGKLYAKRNEALDTGYLVQEEDDFVPASIRVEERTVDVKLRLKGDMVDHVRTSKWSFRVHTKGGGEIFGMRRFSLQHPETRGFQAEVLFLDTLRSLDVLAPRYFFVDVVVNGNDVGLMAMEEHFSTELLERNGRRDGVILRFDESLMWADRVARGREAVNYRGPFDDLYNAPVEAFRSGRIDRSGHLRDQYATAAGLLRAFVEGEIGAAQVFDIDRLGRFLAAAELWGTWHALGWNNQRFYFNPLTMRLEPIGYDADLEGAIGSGSVDSPGSLANRMLQDPDVRAAFQRYVLVLKDAVDSGELLSSLSVLQGQTLRVLRTEFPLLEEVDLSALTARARELPYPPAGAEPPGPFGAYVIADTIEQDGRHYLELSNPLPLEVDVVSIDWAGPSGTVRAVATRAPTALPVTLPPKEDGRKRTSILVEYVPLEGSGNDWMQIAARLHGYSDVKVARVRPGFLPLQTNPRPAGDLETLLARHPFLSLTDDGTTIEVSPGERAVEGSLVIPAGFQFRIPAGTTLLFEPDASVVVYGPTRFLGTTAAPVVLDASPDSPSGLWQGVVVEESGERSVWEHVQVNNTSGVRWGSWELTGGVTFYRSDVTMSECVFRGNRAEDALNIVHSDFELVEVGFLDTASDGLDSDFSTGSIQGGSFTHIGTGGGADGVDVSGSEVVLRHTRFSNVTDKAISVGENSRLTAEHVVARHCATGAASKDGSSLVISDSEFEDASIAALMSYVKKPEYGGASLVADNVTIRGTAKPAWAQPGSRIVMDGNRVPAQDMDVDALYKGSMKRGAGDEN